jgi:hypothetical protein
MRRSGSGNICQTAGALRNSYHDDAGGNRAQNSDCAGSYRDYPAGRRLSFGENDLYVYKFWLLPKHHGACPKRQPMWGERRPSCSRAVRRGTLLPLSKAAGTVGGLNQPLEFSGALFSPHHVRGGVGNPPGQFNSVTSQQPYR